MHSDWNTPNQCRQLHWLFFCWALSSKQSYTCCICLCWRRDLAQTFCTRARSLPIQYNTTMRQSQRHFKSNVIWMIISTAQTVVLETSSKHLFTHSILTSPIYLPRFHSFIHQIKSGNSCFDLPTFVASDKCAKYSWPQPSLLVMVHMV